MYAIVDVAGQQFKVEEGKKIFVHRLENKEGEVVDFDQVLLIDNDGKIVIGDPVIKGAMVSAKVLAHPRGDKVSVFKKKRRKGYKVKTGHRQDFTQLVIKTIIEKGASKPVASKETSAKPAVAKKATAKTAAKPAVAKKATTKTAAKPAVAKKATTKTAAKPAAAKKATAKTAAKPAAAKKATAKTAAKPAAAKKATAKTAAKPAAAKKAPAKTKLSGKQETKAKDK